ncbi:MAG: zinc ribbon domain-containing protein [Akkermansia sp.]|nr:zinc ribbon domain-containing protein [Akkermansia sp.]
MTAKDIFMRTLSFCWLKLGLGMLNVLIDAVLFGILMGLAWLFNSSGVSGIFILIWLGLIGAVNFFLNHYLGYLVKAGHVAVIAEAYRNGSIPDNPFATGKQLVTERFGTANAYFAIDKLVSGAVKQIQRTLGRLTDTILGGLPGVDQLKSCINFFLNIALGYIDECCLCYTFYKKEQSPYKSAADGVAIYAKNWKELLKNAAWTAVSVVLSLVVITLLAFVVFGGTFRLLGWSGLIAFILSLLVAWAIKFAFVDSWIMVKMAERYMSLAPNTELSFDLYGKLCEWSAKFRELFEKSKTEAPTPAEESAPEPLTSETETTAEETSPATEEPTSTPPTEETPAEPVPVEPAPKPAAFCPNCGAPLTPGKPFCANCGNKVQ